MITNFEKKIVKFFYMILIFAMGLTGMGQMPIFQRFYIADIPGFAWLGKYSVTHYIHYIGASLFLALACYCITAYFLSKKNYIDLAWSAYVRIVFIAGIMITGIFRVLKNLPDFTFSPGFTMFINISHLVFTLFLMLSAILFLIIKSGWVKQKN